ncbi:MAG: hypothetical protein EOP45_05055 [Sphingobacteriaceae bacterium]|nr:MAG: hypothetical protein EOP45_05055 [Sphingobacteriaceae bacterium]
MWNVFVWPFTITLCQLLFSSIVVQATFWNAATLEQSRTITQLKSDMNVVMEGIDEIKNQNILLKAVTVSVLDLLIDAVDDLTDNEKLRDTKERTKVLSIARSISRKHRREASILPWDSSRDLTQ